MGIFGDFRKQTSARVEVTKEGVGMHLDRVLERMPSEFQTDLVEQIRQLKIGELIGGSTGSDRSIRAQMVRRVEDWLQKSNLQNEGGGDAVIAELWRSVSVDGGDANQTKSAGMKPVLVSAAGLSSVPTQTARRFEEDPRKAA